MNHYTKTQAFVLHSRPFKNSSALIDLLTKDRGVVTVVAHGARKNTSPLYGCVDLLRCSEVLFTGNKDLKTLVQMDYLSGKTGSNFKINSIFLYVHELILKSRLDIEQASAIFKPYQLLLDWSKTASNLKKGLRRFELLLCRVCGYEITSDALPSLTEWVCFNPIDGIVIDNQHKTCQVSTLSKFLNANKLSEKQLLQIEQLMRQIVSHIVGNQVIKSRDLLAVVDQSQT